MAHPQSALASVIEALVNTAASMGVFLAFGLRWEMVAGLTISMLLKNLGIRRVFEFFTVKWG